MKWLEINVKACSNILNKLLVVHDQVHEKQPPQFSKIQYTSTFR